MSIISLRDVYKNYEPEGFTVKVLKGINLELKHGDFVAIMGTSGSGKTTLMNIIGLLDTPTSGSYYLDSKEVSRLNDDEMSHLRNKKIGFIFQSFYLIQFSNVLENVLLPAYYSGHDTAKYTKRAIQLLEEFGMMDKKKSKPNQLSGGQQQRVAIARALINDPDIILADEPTGQLDSETSLVIMEYIENLHKMGKTVILVTHDKQTASYANKIINIIDGGIVDN